MRYLVALTLVVGWLSAYAPTADAGGMPEPWMNYHKPWLLPRYWTCPPYQIYGPTDNFPAQPVNGIGPPPFGPRSWYVQPRPAQNQFQGHLWHEYVRSPRDFFMTNP
jgi:hypothetical protein